jgi:hypothetical protein
MVAPTPESPNNTSVRSSSKRNGLSLGFRLRPLFHRMPEGHWGTVHPVTRTTATLVPKDSRRQFNACKFCQRPKPSQPMPLSNEQRRLPSNCHQQRAGSRRFDTSSLRYLVPGRTRRHLMAVLDRQFCPVQPQMMVQRMQEQRPSLKESSSWCLPVVVRPVLNVEQTESAEKGSSYNRFIFSPQSKIVVL